MPLVTAFASGTQTATIGTEHFLSNVNVPGLFTLTVDLNALVAGDVVELRVYKMALTAGTPRPYSVATFAGPQPADFLIALSDAIPNELTDSQAVRFSLKQTAGTGRAFPWVVHNLNDATELDAVKAKTDQLAFGVANQVDSNVKSWSGTTVAGAIPPDVIFMRSGTAQGGSTTSITLDAGASAVTDFYKNEVVFIRSGTGAGQAAIITAYNGTTKVATVGGFATAPDATSVFTVAAFGPGAASVTGGVNVTQWNGAAVATPAVAGVPIVDLKYILGSVLTEGVAGRLASGFKEFLDVASQVFNLGSINQTGDSFARLGAPSGASIDADILNVKNQVWDEVLTGATHNVPSSAGRRLRTLSNVVIFDGLVQSATSHSITFQAGPSATNDIYNGNAIILTTGAGAGQTRKIVDWVGGTLTAYLDKPLVTLPSLGDSVQIQSGDTIQLAAMGAVQGVPTSTTVQLESIASAVNDIYNGQTITIFDQTNNNVESRIITAYNGTTKVATVSPALVHTPSAGDAYVVHILGRSMVDVNNVSPTDSPGVTTLLSRIAQAILFDASGFVKADVEDWRAALANALIAGRVDSNAQVVGDKTGYALTAGEHTLITADDVAAFVSQGYTTTRAGYLDTLNGLVAAIWNALTSGMATAGSIGLLLKTDIDAAISSRSTLTQAQILSDATPFPGADINATISSRAAPGAQMDLVNAPNATAITAFATAIWNALTSGMITAGSIGNLLSQFRFTIANQVDANALSGGGAGLTAAQVWAYLTASAVTPGSFGALLKQFVFTIPNQVDANAVSGGGAGLTAQAVWSYVTRTLTQAGAAAVAAMTGSKLTLYNKVTFNATLTGLAIPATWVKVYLTAKQNAFDTDAQAVLQLQVSNPGAGTDGITVLLGATPTPTQQAYGSLVVNQGAGTVAIQVKANVDFASVNYQTYYDVKVIDAAGNVTLLAAPSTFTILQAETGAIS